LNKRGLLERTRYSSEMNIIITNADIITMDPDVPKASALAVKDGRICHVGDSSSISAFVDRSSHILDLRGKTLCPGFIDAHLHFRALGESFSDTSLKSEAGIQSVPEIQYRLKAVVKDTPPGEWIRGAGYHEAGLEEQRHPDRHDLDAVSIRHPIKLTHRSGYAHVLNTQALEKVGIFRHTPDPDDGIIDRDPDTGDPNGVLYNMGQYLSLKIPPIAEDVLEKGVKQANGKLLSCGITTIMDASFRNDSSRRAWFHELKKSGALTPGVLFVQGFPAFKKELKTVFETGKQYPGIISGGIKIIVDETTGRLLPDQEDLNGMVKLIHEQGKQAVIHAIEIDAIRVAVSAIENALDRHPKTDHRHRIEHCSVCPPDLIGRIGALGITVVTHPAFVHYNGDRYLKTVLSEHQPFLYPMGSLLKAGIRVAAASDAPMVPPDPISGIYGAVTRLTGTKKGVFPEEAVGARDALDMYTVSAAESGFLEKSKGSVSVGKDADFVVLSGNPFDVRPEGIRDIDVLMTIIDGDIVWKKEGPKPLTLGFEMVRCGVYK
jgi:predicted amidohydrolase YtcJ